MVELVIHDINWWYQRRWSDNAVGQMHLNFKKR